MPSNEREGNSPRTSKVGQIKFIIFVSGASGLVSQLKYPAFNKFHTDQLPIEFL